MVVSSLGDFQIGVASVQTGTSVSAGSDLGDISSVCLSARLGYGAGGSAIIAVIQTSLDQGTTWIDIARFDFTTFGVEKIMNLTKAAITSPYSVTDLASEGSNNGIIGDRFRAVVTSTGTYTGSTLLSLRMVT
jgi:hypothetical protein